MSRQVNVEISHVSTSCKQIFDGDQAAQAFAGGRVEVARINEASIAVDTGGGALRIGKIKASRAELHAGGRLDGEAIFTHAC